MSCTECSNKIPHIMIPSCMDGVGAEGLLEMASKIAAVNTSKGFTLKDVSFGEVIALIHSELSEALEEYREGNPINYTYYNNKNILKPELKPEGVPSELADVIIRVLHFCHVHHINIGEMIEEKLRYNTTREHRHGGKKL